MKTLYLECGMGAAGDMLTAALLSLLPEPDSFLSRLNAALPPGVTVTAKPAEQAGILGTAVTVLVGGEEEHSGEHSCHHAHEHSEHEHHHAHEHHEHHHAHTSLADITALIGGTALPEAVRARAVSVYELLAEAESRAHGRPVGEVHFHEVGAMDAVADITAVCLLMHELAPDRVIVSPVCTGFGSVYCAHGILPVPAPAAADLLRGIPCYSGEIEGELCTPTGAALLRTFADSFGEMPVMRTERIGYGMGKKHFPRMNCVRAFWGETADTPDEIVELSCNLDDMTGEALGFAQEILRQAGALDVFTVPVMMKKNRPGVLLTVLCRPEDQEKTVQLLFRHTETLGVRMHRCGRYTLARREETVQTASGAVRVKYAEGFGVRRAKPAYDDLAAIAGQTGRSLAEIRAEICAEIPEI